MDFKELLAILAGIGCRDLIFIIIGAIAYALLNKRSLIIKKVKKSPIETVMICLIAYIVFCQFLNPNPVKEKSFDMLNFLCNMAFAWILTQYSVKNDFKDQQKQLSSISYGHSINVNNKLKFNIKLIELAEKQLNKCTCSNSEACALKHHMSKIKEHLMFICKDTEQNMRDWAVNLADEINQFKEIGVKQQQLKIAEGELQELYVDEKNNSSKIYDKKRSIKKLNNDIDHIKNDMNQFIRYTFEDVENKADPYLADLQKAIDYEDVKQIVEKNFIKDKMKALLNNKNIFQDNKNIENK